MDSRSNYLQDPSPECIKISDSQVLHISAEKWNSFIQHLNRNKLNKEALEKEKRHKAYLAEGSRSMIKNWANSVENIRKKKEEKRLQAIENAKAERAKNFNQLREEQEEIRKIFVEKADKKIFMNKGNAKELTSAYILSEVLYEREKQEEFNKFLKKHEEEEYAKEVADVRRITKEAEEEQKGYIENEKRKKLEIGEQMRKELEAKIKKEKEGTEEGKMKEIKDYNEALQEMKCMEQKDLEMKLKKKQTLKKDMEEMLEKERQKKILLITEEQELDDVIKAYRLAKDRIDCMRKIREKELREEVIRHREENVRKVRAISMEFEEEQKRQKALEKALRENEEKEIQKEREKVERKAQEVRDKLEGRRQFIEKEEERLKTEEELRKWEMLNRFKTKEAIEAFDTNHAEERKNKTLKYRDELLQQIADNENRLKKEKEIDRILTEAMFLTDDVKFFAYATEIWDKQKKTGRSTYPTTKAIANYKKNNNILS